MVKQSAGILLYRWRNGRPELLLVHPGGPFFKKKDAGAWSIPKGEFLDGENPQTVALRELQEETGHLLTASLTPLTPIKQKGGKQVFAWAAEDDLDAAAIVSNTFSLIWPPRSGRVVEFPEVDRAAWFPEDQAREKINPGQVPFIDELIAILARDDRRIEPQFSLPQN
jgi:predicted NUDIX family NTP pyrophosphohydrolase